MIGQTSMEFVAWCMRKGVVKSHMTNRATHISANDREKTTPMRCTGNFCAQRQSPEYAVCTHLPLLREKKRTRGLEPGHEARVLLMQLQVRQLVSVMITIPPAAPRESPHSTACAAHLQGSSGRTLECLSQCRYHQCASSGPVESSSANKD